MRPLRIVHVLASMDPAEGGPPSVVARLAAAQAKLGHAVTVLARHDRGRDEAIAKSLAGIPGIDKVEFKTIPDFIRGVLATRAVRGFLRATVSEAEVVQLHGIWNPQLLAASREARRQRVPYIVTPHGMLDPWSLQQSKLKKRIALALGYRHMLKHAAGFHMLNADEANLIEPLNLPPRRFVIPNGVFIEEIEPLPKPGSFYAQHPELQGEPFILFLSRLHYKKGLDYLAEAFAIVASRDARIRLVVAGPDGGAKAEFETRIQEFGLSERMHVVGSIYGREKFAAMVDAACFCLPSRQEGFSMAITECIACGTPVVISENCHFPEIATARAGEVVKLSAADVASALLRIVGDDEMRGRMGASGRKLVQRSYTWPIIAQQTINMYEAVQT